MLVNQLESIMARNDVSPLLQLSSLSILCIVYLAAGRPIRCRHAIDDALAAATESGIHLFDFLFLADGVYSGLLAGDLATARRYLKRMERVMLPEATWDVAQYHFLAAATAILAEDWSQAEFYLNSGREMAKTCGTPFPIIYTTAILSQLLLQQGDLARALAELNHLSSMEALIRKGTGHFFYQLILADCARAQNHKEKMISHLRSGFMQAAASGLHLPLGFLRPRLAVLCAEALEAGIHPSIVTDFVNRMQLAPPPSGQVGEQWPWPLKLYTLGRMEIVGRDQAIDLGIKPPKKPLELLRLLVCRNGHEITRETVADTLWPETDGDRAVQNINTTLHRLRKLLGSNNQAVLLENGRLSLNPAQCWVDAWHFDALTEQARSVSDPPAQMDLLARAIAAYGGAFDGIQDDNPWAIGYDQRLRTLWVDAVVTLGRLYSKAGRSDRSEALFQKSLTLDDTAEPVYQSLMTVLDAQGRTAEALLVFNRCRSVLARRGMEPTQKTLALAQDLTTAKTASARSSGQFQ